MSDQKYKRSFACNEHGHWHQDVQRKRKQQKIVCRELASSVSKKYIKDVSIQDHQKH